MEPDALVQCPYDRNHQNNPQVSRTLATCPFNARHRVPRALLRAHVTSCPDKLPLELPPDPEDTAKTAHTWQPPPCQEDWDAELSELEEPPPFILHVTKGDLPVPCHSPDPAAPPEGLPLRKPRPATAGQRLGTAGPRWGTAGQRLGTAGPRAGTARPRPVTAGGGRGVPGAGGAPPAVRDFRK
ncbi:gametocyte-specific factor 1-like isoform X2 [Haemorhous mexicanus]|uniref:gametocyte-specific factor 1-like isoform X2 n=1 Tax=Haemorhous mexicanus TaxID=30427 RepID=UPI0028BE958F|nr:gametocyte-specific factor 1-like isoform X2 [Haemorhous mexicanus]